MIKKILGLVLIFALFFLSRHYIWKYWPTNYSDVRTDYERYARMWHYGLIPYTHHMYEYPPITIPILSLPLKYEHLGVNYYHNYRFEVLLVDVIFFVIFIASISLLFKNKSTWKKYAAIGFYLTITTIAKNFFYEGLDLMFTASMMTALFALLWLNNQRLVQKTIIWFFFWLSTGIKFLTLPLMVPLFIALHSNFKKDLLAMIVGFILVWGIPIIIYGKTLATPFVINFDRPMKYSSFPSYVVQIIDNFTQTETHSQNPPDFALFGPVAEKVTAVNEILFPLSMLIWLLWSIYFLYKQKYPTHNLKNILSDIFVELKKPSLLTKEVQFLSLLRIFALYLFTLFIFAKIFSQPFHIWYMAVFAIYPFLNNRKPYLLWTAGLLMVIQDTTTLFYLPAGQTLGMHNYLWGYTFKYLLMFSAYLYFLKDAFNFKLPLPKSTSSQKQSR